MDMTVSAKSGAGNGEFEMESWVEDDGWRVTPKKMEDRQRRKEGGVCFKRSP